MIISRLTQNLVGGGLAWSVKSVFYPQRGIKYLRSLLVLIVGLIVAGQAFAHTDYTRELFSYQDEFGNEFAVESLWTDGILIPDPGYLRIVDESWQVVYQRDYVKDIITIEESLGRYSVFEFGNGFFGFIPTGTIIFEDGRYFEGSATATEFFRAIWQYLGGIVIFSVIFSLFFILAQGPVKSMASFWKLSVMLIVAPIVILGGDLLLMSQLILAAYWLFKLIFWLLRIGIKKQKFIVKIAFCLLFLVILINGISGPECDDSACLEERTTFYYCDRNDGLCYLDGMYGNPTGFCRKNDKRCYKVNTNTSTTISPVFKGWRGGSWPDSLTGWLAKERARVLGLKNPRSD